MQIGVDTARAVDQRRVFIVEPDEITRAVLQFILQDEIETHEMSSPEEVYEKGQDWLKPDLVLLSAGVVEARGAAVVDDLTTAYPGVRVLVVHDKNTEAPALAALRAGAHGALAKPLGIEAVRKKVDTGLGRGGAPLIQLSL
ncbi:response regulator [Acidocella sp.]|uniref:response regulator n=1 Tax=Acidocella sp. TaxID=50710 RepID=UPI00182C4C91|nr:response regulator [Acidocella sp.]NNM57770.1 response regulator transcription factor [Acidocella sp.]